MLTREKYFYEIVLKKSREQLLNGNFNQEEISDSKLLRILTEIMIDLEISPKIMAKLLDSLFCKLKYKLGVIEPLVKDFTINEIMVNGYKDIFIERNKTIEKLNLAFQNTEELEDVIRRIAADVNREINEMNPILDARLDNGSRVNAVYKNVAMGGPVLTIRKFSKDRITLDELIEGGSLSEEAGKLLKILVKCGYNIFISGGTSSGKTTFLNSLSDFIPNHERVIVIEDSLELQITNIDNIVRLECKLANSTGKGQVDMEQLIKSSLRMRPSRIIVGEVRGKEVFQMIQAMNTGHRGSLSTGHGNSIIGMLRRLESMYLMAYHIPIEAIRVQIVEALDIMIHLERMTSGKRIVTEIAEVIGYENGEYKLNRLFQLDECCNLIKTGNEIINNRYMRMNGEDYGL